MGLPLWLVDSPPPRPSLEGATTVDLAIVGGGMAGCTAALLAARRGLKVLLLEAQTVGNGATGRNAGFVLAGLAERYVRAVGLYGRDRARRLWELTRYNHGLVAELVADLQIDCAYRKGGSLQVATDAHEVQELRQSVALLQEDGFQAQFLARAPEPLRTAGYVGALYLPEDGELDPVAFVRGLAQAAEAEGVGLMEHSEVLVLEEEHPGQVVLKTRSGRVDAGACLLCTNAWSGALVSSLEKRIIPTRGQMLATAPLDPLFDTPVYANHGYEYWRQRRDGRLLLGGWRYLDPEGEHGTSEVIHRGIQQAMDSFLHRFPQLRGVEVTHRWSGPMGFSQDGLPLVGPALGHTAVFLAAGFTGHGFGFACVCAQMAVELLLEGRAEDAELLAPRRFFS